MPNSLKYLFLFILIHFISFQGFSQWTTLNPGTSNHLHDVWFISADTGWIIGDTGTMLKTVDGGQNWFALDPKTDVDLQSIFFADDQNVFVTGSSSKVIHSDDGGNIWSNISFPTGNGTVFKSFFTDALNGFVVGDFSIGVLKTTNGGLNWTQLPTGAAGDRKDVFFTGSDTGMIAGSGNTDAITRTDNGGVTWSNVFNNTTMDLEAIHFVTETRGYVTGQGGKIYKTWDNGATWQFNGEVTWTDFYDIHFPMQSTGVVVGGNTDNGPEILRTETYGSMWGRQAAPGNSILRAVFMVDENIGYIVGDNGTVLKTTNGGGLLNSLESVPTEPISSLFPNPVTTTIQFETEKEGTWELIDMSGKVVLYGSMHQGTNHLNVGQVQNGAYQLVTATSEGQVHQSKILKVD